MLLLLSLMSMNIAYAELQVTYFQTEVKIVEILANDDLLSDSGAIFKQGNDLIENLESYVGKHVYIKYFNALENDFYVDVKSKKDGEFDLTPERTKTSPEYL